MAAEDEDEDHESREDKTSESPRGGAIHFHVTVTVSLSKCKLGRCPISRAEWMMNQSLNRRLITGLLGLTDPFKTFSPRCSSHHSHIRSPNPHPSPVRILAITPW